MNSIQLSFLNKKISEDAPSFIKGTNEAYYLRLLEIADDIERHKNEKPIILLSGPSGSGKTTTAHMIEAILDEKGCETHTLSMDNYFKPLTDEEKQLLSEGRLDLENPGRVDVDFLGSQLEAINNCEEIELPIYDFKDSLRLGGGKFQRKPGELVILEGIHSLNPDVVTVPDEKTAKIYVSVRTRIADEDKLLHPSKIRLMRRMIRDSIFRKRSFGDTMGMFTSVEEGENKYIMPYKSRSTYDVDTFMSYEICAYRSRLLDELSAMKNQPLVEDICGFLSEVKDVPADIIPTDSLIREFIG